MASEKSETFTMDRIRLESIEKRRRECNSLIKSRKRKLSELYCVSRLPLLPISNDQVLQIEDKLMSFLERNDLENGHEFNISILANEKQPPRRTSQPQSQSQSRSGSPIPPQILPISSSASTPTQASAVAAITQALTSEPDSGANTAPVLSASSPIKVATTLQGSLDDTSSVNTADSEGIVLPETKKQKLDQTTNDIAISSSVVIPEQDSRGTSGPTASGTVQSESEGSAIASSLQDPDESSKANQTPVPAAGGVSVRPSETPVITANGTPAPQQSITNDSSDNNTNNIVASSIPMVTSRHIESSEDEEPTLSTLIRSFSENKKPRRVDERSIRDLDYENIDINKLIVMLMPENKPHKVPEANSLTELYYHQQTIPLAKLLIRTHKSLTTDAFESALVEGKVQVLYSRMEELKRKNNWSLRQPKKYIDPFIQKGHLTHWDYLLSEMKWLSTDIKQERKFKMVQCYYMSQAVMDYWNYGKVCCIKTKPMGHTEKRDTQTEESNTDVAMTDANLELQEGSKDDKSVDGDSSLEKVHKDAEMDIVQTDTLSAQNIEDDEDDEEEDILMVDAKEELDSDNSQSDSFQNPENENENESDSIDISKLLERVDPLSEYEPRKLPIISEEEFSKISQNSKKSTPFKLYANLDEFNKTDLAIVANLPPYMPFGSNEKHHVIENSEYGHISFMLPPVDEEAEYEKVLLKKQKDSEKHGLNYQKGLFGPISYRRFNILKPPMPPSIKNLELRIPTIWLPQDDKSLIRYVTDYSFNWNIISAHLSAKPTNSYTSNIERRTPWQCFERYIQLNDKFQFSDMRGAYSLVAKEWLESAHKVQTTTKRRISPLGVGIESIQRGHRRLRWGSMFDAMRKLIRKRENITKPSQQPRKFNSDDKRLTDRTPTPSELAKLKFERDKAIQEAYLNQTAGRVPGGLPVATNGNAQMNGNNIPRGNPNGFNNNPNVNNNGQMRHPQMQGQQPTPAQIQAMQQRRAQAAAAAAAAGNQMSPQTAPNGAGMRQMPTQAQLAAAGINNPQAAAALAAAVARNGNNMGNANGVGSPGVNMGPGRSSSAMATSNNVAANNQMRSNSQGNGQIRSSTPNGTQYTNEQIQQLMYQRRLLQQQQAQQGKPASGSTPTPMQVLQQNASNNNSNNSGSNSGYSSPMNSQVNILPQLNSRSNSQNSNMGAQGTASPQILPQQTTSSSSPPASSTKLNFTTAQVSAIINQIQNQNPKLSKDQVTKLAVTYLTNYQQTQNKAAAAAAAAAANQGNVNADSGTPSNSSRSNSNGSTPNKSGNGSSTPQPLTPQQITAYLNNPNITPQQRKQLQLLQKQNIQLQQQRQKQQQQQQQLQTRGQPSPVVTNQANSSIVTGSSPSPARMNNGNNGNTSKNSEGNLSDSGAKEDPK